MSAVEIDVRLVAADAEAMRDVETLSADERLGLARLARDDDRRARVAARALVRTRLAPFYGVRPSRVPLTLEAGGKPTASRGPQFSIAHAGAFVAVAFSPRELGIDVEPIRDQGDLDLMIATYASPAEEAALRSSPAPVRSLRFLTMWVRKEAVLKACGLGLAVDPASIDVRGDVTVVDGRTWRIAAVDAGPDHLCAVAVDAAPHETLRIRTSPDGGLHTRRTPVPDQPIFGSLSADGQGPQ